MEKLRCDMDSKFFWSIDEIFDNHKNYSNAVEEVKVLTNKLIKYEGTITKSSNNLLEYLNADQELDIILSKLYVYTHMLVDQDSTNDLNKSYKEEILSLYSEVLNKTSFASVEILETDYEVIKKYINENKELHKYDLYLKRLFKYVNHTLSKAEEELLSNLAPVRKTGSKVFYNLNNADIKLGKLYNEDDEEVELTHSNYPLFLRSTNKRVRNDAYNLMYKYYKEHENTISECYKNELKENVIQAKIKKFSSPLVSSLYADSIDESVYKNLIISVSDKLNVIHDYYNFKRSYFNLDKMYPSDLYLELNSNNSHEYEFDEAKELLFKSLTPLGSEYLMDLNKAFDDNWIDLYPNKGKRSGAYSWGSYGTKPYVLMNYNKTFDSVSTLAHELGHAMHSYYSDKHNSNIYAQYPIFLAEVASTVNEVLLIEYMLKNTTDKNEKIYYINNLLETIKGTVIRQTMFAEYEMLMHEYEQNNTPITTTLLNNTYKDLIIKYHGSSLEIDDLIKYEWMRIPHFYSAFYVYKYATGLSAAISIAYDILDNKENALDKYLEFLKSGCNDEPLNILSKTKVDMTKSDAINKTLDIFKEKLEELKTLTKIRGEDVE